MTQKFSNNAASKLMLDITDSHTHCTILPCHADKFPVCTEAGDFFKVTLEDNQGNSEIVRVGSRALGSNVFKDVLRAQEGSAARAFPVGTIVELRFTAADAQVHAQINATLTTSLATVLHSLCDTNRLWFCNITVLKGTS